MGNRLEFADLIGQCNALLGSLRSIEPEGKWDVANITCSSPARFDIASQEPSKYDGSKFLETWQSLVLEGRIPPDIDRSSLPKHQRVLKLARKISTTIQNHRFEPIKITQNTTFPSIDEFIYQDAVVSVGSVKGKLESINIHNKQVIGIYPSAGPNVVECNISKAMIQEAGKAIDHFVIVTGKKYYKSREVFPHRIDVTKIDILDENYLTWGRLRGTTPGITEGRPSEEYIRELRDAEE